jgi:hypothetical protein
MKGEKMLRRFGLGTFLVVLALTVAVPAALATRGGEGGRGDGPVIYVTTQGLYYDSIVTADPLPWKGPFQKLEVVGGKLQTEFGPGDPGHTGGRWWTDTNPNGYQDAADHYFLCPLLGPGRETP